MFELSTPHRLWVQAPAWVQWAMIVAAGGLGGLVPGPVGPPAPTPVGSMNIEGIAGASTSSWPSECAWATSELEPSAPRRSTGSATNRPPLRRPFALVRNCSTSFSWYFFSAARNAVCAGGSVPGSRAYIRAVRLVRLLFTKTTFSIRVRADDNTSSKPPWRNTSGSLRGRNSAALSR